MFGDWINNIDALYQEFVSAKPYEHVIISNFFTEDVAKSLYGEFPDPRDPKYDWKHYDNPLEQKYTLNKLHDLHVHTKVFQQLQSPEAVHAISRITGISNLESDPYLHGAGLHAYPTNGKLDVHLDYSIHPLIKKERRVNLIIYMNPTWKEEYGGHLQLWDSDMQHCNHVIPPSWNTAVLFRTNNISYHGIPKPITCPNGEYRKSLAIYYVSEPTNDATPRYKAEFFPAPNQPVHEKLQKLYDIRKNRIIYESDLEDWPSWRKDGNGHW